MALELVDFERKARKAVKAFWSNRESARLKQLTSGRVDQGERAGVTGGRNMDGFLEIIIDVVRANGLQHASIHRDSSMLHLPGYFRPTKMWDVLVTNGDRLVAAIEFKSQVGPSFGNNFNNRVEESIGTAHDFWTAYREGAFGRQPRPFVGWLMLVENDPKSCASVGTRSPHFQVFPEFESASYLQRYDLLCQRLVQEHMYTSASVIATKKAAVKTGKYETFSEMTNLRTFITTLAGHIASEAARIE